MVSGVKKDTGSFVYMRVKKHSCPECGEQMKVVKMTKVVRAKSKEAKNFDFTACDLSLGDKVKFIWYEFKCKDCDKTYTEEAMKAIEKQQKKEERAARREAKKAERAAARQAAKEAKKSAPEAETKTEESAE
jgi:transposase-like protein